MVKEVVKKPKIVEAPTLRQSLRDLVPSKLQGDLEEILDYFEHELVAADVSDRISDADLS